MWTLIWIGVALVFNLALYFLKGQEPALQFLTGYLIEKTLSIDNLFVFYILFARFKLNVSQQKRILSYGIFGAVFFRGFFILLGSMALKSFHWTSLILGAILVISGLRFLVRKERSLLDEPATMDASRENHFFVRNPQGKWLRWKATPMFIALLLVEGSDILFALDSVPAVLAITSDPLIVYSSNIFAILGLRSLYLTFQGVISQLKYFHYGISAITIFVGVKLLSKDYFEISTLFTLGFISLTLGIVAVLSFKSQSAKKTESLPSP